MGVQRHPRGDRGSETGEDAGEKIELTDDERRFLEAEA
jgi:hypothetical protein